MENETKVWTIADAQQEDNCMSIFLFIAVALFLPVSLIVMLTRQTLENRRRRQQGLPPKKHHNIKDLNLIDVYVHSNDD